jgi:hypothetical protein
VSLAIVALSLSLCACGSSSSSGAHSHTRASSGKAAAGKTATRGAGVPAAAAAVIEGWANALRAGNPGRAAAYWAQPSVMVNGPNTKGQITLIHIRNAREAMLADETLSCGATLHHTTRRGSYVEGEFTLSIRAGAGASSSGCSGPANVDFLIRRRHIVRWLRAPVSSSTPAPRQPQKGEGTSPQSI